MTLNIFLQSQSDIVSWASVFRILGYELCIPIWKIIDIPETIINNPKPILDIAKFFFKRSDSIWTPKIMTSDEEVANHFEAQRMLDLGLLYDCFGRIVKSYKAATAKHLYEWGDRYFIHEKWVFWSEWFTIFTRLNKSDLFLPILLKPKDKKQLSHIINKQAEEKAEKEKQLNIQFEILCQKFSIDKEQINLLNEVSLSDINIVNNFDDVNEELTNIFNFDLILKMDYACKIWQFINDNLEIEVREKIFECGVEVSKNLGVVIDEKFKSYCLNI